MGAHSTLNITRSKARLVVLEALVERIDDEGFLEMYLNQILGDRLYNAVIVPDHFENDDNMI